MTRHPRTEATTGVWTFMRPLALLCVTILLAGCGGSRTYARATLAPLSDAYSCAVNQLKELRYSVELEDPIGGVAQGRREITGFVERARRGLGRATRAVTLGVAGGTWTRYDEITISVYRRRYPGANTLEVTAGMLSIAGELEERTTPTDEARGDARRLIDACAPRF
jgi:hypothetical protein